MSSSFASLLQIGGRENLGAAGRWAGCWLALGEGDDGTEQAIVP